MAPDDRPLPREAFIAAAQLYGLMPDIDRWTVARLLVHCADDIKRRLLSLALPASHRQPAEHRLPARADGKVRASSLLPPQALLFSVDEAVVLERTAQCRACLRELQQLGCRLIVNGFDLPSMPR